MIRRILPCLVIVCALLLTRPVLAQSGCVAFTQGYWKNHPEALPVSELALGQTTYSKDQLLSILRRPVRGNGLVALAHQLIAAKLNVLVNEAAGYGTPSEVTDAIAAADALIGQLVIPPVGQGWLHPSVTSELVAILDDYNEGAYPCEGGGGLPGGGC
ncbi:MAG: hypothetical protein ACP5U2_08775 [Bryobacteraceae bacterium]